VRKAENLTAICEPNPQASYTDHAAALVPTFAGRGYRVVIATNSYGR
jgi:hypothetical protein